MYLLPTAGKQPLDVCIALAEPHPNYGPALAAEADLLVILASEEARNGN